MSEIKETSNVPLQKPNENDAFFTKNFSLGRNSEKADEERNVFGIKENKHSAISEQKFIPVPKRTDLFDKGSDNQFSSSGDKKESIIDRLNPNKKKESIVDRLNHDKKESIIDRLNPKNKESIIDRLNPNKKKESLPLKNFTDNFAKNSNIAGKIDNLVGKISIGKGEFTNLKFSQLFPNADNLQDESNISNKLLETGTARFLEKNKDLVVLFNENPDLLAKLSDSNIESQDDVKRLVVDFVLDKFKSGKSVSKDFFEDNFLLTKFTAFDLGGISNILDKDSSAFKAFTADKTFGIKLSEDNATTEAAKLFQNSSTFNTSFFSQNPLSSFHFLSSTSAVKDAKQEKSNSNFESNNNAEELGRSRFTKSDNEKDNDELFVSRTSAREKDFQSEAVDFVFKQLNRGSAFDKDFLSSNTRFTNAVANDFFANKNNSVVEFLNNNSSLTKISEKPFDLDKIFTSFQADQASKKLPKDFPIDKEFLEENFNVAFLINGSPEFTDALVKDKDNVEQFINLNANNKNKTKPDRFQTLTNVNNALNNFFSTFNSGFSGNRGVNVDLTA